MPIDTTELRRIVGAMTTGEWFSQEVWPGHCSLEVRGGERIFDCNEFDRHGEAKRADAAGIAYLKNNALALADEIDRLRADLAALRSVA